MRIGLISDTHTRGQQPLPAAVFRAFRGVDLILHAGDIYSPYTLEELAHLAPVYAARGNGDAHALCEQSADGNGGYVVRETHLLEIGQRTVGLIHAFPTPDDEPYVDHLWLMQHRFGTQPDIIVCGDTHVENVARCAATTIINPGSPTLPHHIERLGSIALLDLYNSEFSITIVQLGELGAATPPRDGLG